MLRGYEFIEPEMGIRETPPNRVPSVAPPEGKLYRSRRIFAFLIDVFVQDAVSIGAYLGARILLLVTFDWLGYSSSVILDDMGAGGLVGALIVFSIVIRLKVICEGLSGQTLGKKMTGLIVVMEEGAPCTLWAALIRSLALLVDTLFWGFVGLVRMRSNPWKQRFGDSWGKTVVLTTKQPTSQLARGRIPFFAAFIIALLFEGVLASLMLASQLLSNPIG